VLCTRLSSRNATWTCTTILSNILIWSTKETHMVAHRSTGLLLAAILKQSQRCWIMEPMQMPWSAVDGVLCTIQFLRSDQIYRGDC
jgi:hypothetical protein